MRRSLRPVLSAALCAAFFVQSTGAADLAPVFARGMMLPPPGAMGGASRLPINGSTLRPTLAVPVKPAGEPWLASAVIVARWVTERLTAPAAATAMPTPKALAAFSSAATNELSALASIPAPEPPADRMLIAMEGRRLVASGIAAQVASLLQTRRELQPLRPRFVGEWVGKGGAVQVRVDYLKPLGITRGEAKGYRVTLSDGYERLFPNRGALPEALMRELPLYFAGDSVDVEVTILNTGSTPLSNLSVSAVQEEFTASGEAGAPVTSPVLSGVANLAPGATSVLRWRVKLSSDGREAVNFEQTHLRVSGKDETGSDKVLLDAPQAGIVDPPGQ